MDALVPREVDVGSLRLPLLVPPDAEALLDEQAFEHEEFLPYWAELWPSGVALAEAVAAARPPGSVLELGCGLGLPSIAAALCGADVLATDWAPDAIALLERNGARAGARLRTLCWSWTEDPGVLEGPFDLVLAADVVYERRNVGQLLAVLPRLADEVWMADPGRPALDEFLEGAERDWSVERDAKVFRLRRATAWAAGRRRRR